MITLASLPPNTLKVDIRPVLQRFGEVKRIFVHPGGRRADVAFADVHGVRRTLHAYAEKPLRVRGKEIIVFRKQKRADLEGGDEEPDFGAGVGAAWREGSFRTPASSSSHTRYGQGRGDGAIFVSSFPPGTTPGELAEVLAQFGKYERMVMRMQFLCFSFCVLLSKLVVIIGPDSKYAFFVYSSEHRAEEVLRVHHRIPITVRGRSLRIECTENRPYSLSSASMGSPLEIGKPLDAATSSAIVEELRRTVPKWRGSNEPSRVIWIGRLPTNISREALTNFWSRLGCVVEVRTSTLIAAQCLSSTYS
jgi:hypothetical protein